MYHNIAVALDKSRYSILAEHLSVEFAKQFNATVTGYHIYSGMFHRIRFEALEPYLPPRYQEEELLRYQRRIHSVLIERGLEIISLEYMKEIRELCIAEKIPFRGVIKDGKNTDALVNATIDHDLIILGPQGIGAADGSKVLGGTASAILQHSRCDVLIARTPLIPRKILIGLDGSIASLEALEKGLKIAALSHGQVKLISVFNPVLHRTVFELLSRVLSENAGEVFRFNEQEALHSTIIDQSLSQLYERYLDQGCIRANEMGFKAPDLVKREGIAWSEICNEAAEGGYDLVVIGRFGMHKGKYTHIGSTAERITRECHTNVLIAGGGGGTREEAVHKDEKVTAREFSESPLQWTEDARIKIEKVPSFARSMAVLAIERYAREHEIVTITPDVMDLARERFGL